MRSRLLLLRRIWRLSAATLFLIGVVVAELLLAYQTTKANTATDIAVEVDQTIIDLATVAEGAIVDMETGYRGFLLSGQDAFLEPYSTAQPVYQSDLAQLGAADHAIPRSGRSLANN